MSKFQRMWDRYEQELLVSMYPDCHTDDVAAWLERTRRSVYQMAMHRGIKKSADYIVTEFAGRIQQGKGHPAIEANRLRKGEVPWNKGKRNVNGFSSTRFPVNSAWNRYGPDIGRITQLRGALTRQINQHARNLHEHQAAH